MKRLALLPAFLLVLASATSCDKTEVEPASASTSTASAAPAPGANTPMMTGDALTQGKTVTPTVTGTYPYQETINKITYNRTGTFTSSLRITSFVVQDGVIKALGTLSATPTSGPAAAYGAVAVVIPLSLAQIKSSCAGAQVSFGTQRVVLNGVSIAVYPVLRVSPNQSSKNLLGNLLCSLGKILANPSAKDTGGVVAHLNKIISVIGS